MGLRVYRAVVSCPNCGRLIARTKWHANKKKIEAQVRTHTMSAGERHLTCRHCNLAGEVLIATGEIGNGVAEEDVVNGGK